ncbi:MAG TPA: DUF3047 domain-containing protein [Burkholderiaceae bacterium]
MRKWMGIVVVALGLARMGSAVASDGVGYDAFERQVKTALAPLAGKAIAGLKVLHLSADVGPWQDTGMQIQQGEQVTIVLDGQVWLSRQYQLTLEPYLQVWHRIGAKGQIARGARNTDTITAREAGTLQFKNLPTRWLDRQGGYAGEPAAVNPDAGGGVNIALIRWTPGTNVAAELGKLAAQAGGPAWPAAERERLASPATAPAGWSYLWELGPADIFKTVAASADGGPTGPRLGVHTHKDVAILQKEVRQALTPQTRLQWSWRVDALPAQGPENSPIHHDYLSIAVEFDNGQDLTYLWSRELPVGLSFRCPLEGWKDRETHIVARSGSGDLQKWLDESVNVWEDYQRAVGGPMPRQITKVWIIANSVFGRQTGAGQFGDIRLQTGTQTRKVW